MLIPIFGSAIELGAVHLSFRARNSARELVVLEMSA